MTKEFSAACERNTAPILAVLQRLLRDGDTVLEIGSGTGQHAAAFGAALPGASWQTSDLPDNHPSIRAWLDEAALPNVRPPFVLDMRAPAWPAERYDMAFSANTLHIMAWPEVERLFAGVAAVLKPGGLLVVYGPFNEGGRFTSESNAAFDASLRAHAPQRGIRDIEAVDRLATAGGLARMEDIAMPANNRMVVWRAAA